MKKEEKEALFDFLADLAFAIADKGGSELAKNSAGIMHGYIKCLGLADEWDAYYAKRVMKRIDEILGDAPGVVGQLAAAVIKAALSDCLKEGDADD